MSEHVEPQNEVSVSQDMGLVKRIIGVFLSPSATFAAVRQRPNWLVPAIIIVLISLGQVHLMKPVIQKEQQTRIIEKMEEKGVPQEQIDNTLEKSMKAMNYTIYPTVVIVTFINFLIGAAIWFFVGRTILGADVKYAQMLGVNVYRYFITTLGGLIKLPIILAKQTLNVHFSLATFLPDAQKETFLYKFLAQVEVFNIWSIAVLCIGIAVVTRTDVKKIWPWVVILFVLWYVVSIGVGSLVG